MTPYLCPLCLNRYGGCPHCRHRYQDGQSHPPPFLDTILDAKPRVAKAGCRVGKTAARRPA